MEKKKLANPDIIPDLTKVVYEVLTDPELMDPIEEIAHIIADLIGANPTDPELMDPIEEIAHIIAGLTGANLTDPELIDPIEEIVHIIADLTAPKPWSKTPSRRPRKRNIDENKSVEDFCYQCKNYDSDVGFCYHIKANVLLYPKKFLALCNGKYYLRDT